MDEQPIVLVIEDDDSLREAMCETLELAGYSALGTSCGEEALTVVDEFDFRLVISDVQMPGLDGHEVMGLLHKKKPEMPFVLVTAFGSVGQAVNAIQKGAADYLVKPFEAEVLIEVASRFACPPPSHPGVLAKDQNTRDVLRLAERVADSDATVMISGESGTGKEVFARFIHDHSCRANSPFVAINCAAIPESMLESILFGYEKGAFTGAYRSRAGKFEQANGGTLLLDEISELDISIQEKLLRVLQEKEVERLGGSDTIPLNVRVLATTNRNLRAAVSAGEFREDLYYRLNVFPLKLPPLRDRPKDIVALTEHFVDRFSAGEFISVDTGAMRKLQSHDWPGNVRELENVVQRAMILRAGNVLSEVDFSFEESPASSIDEPLVAQELQENNGSLEDDLRATEQNLIMDAIRAEGGSKQGAAERLGISPRTLRYKLARFREDSDSAISA